MLKKSQAWIIFFICIIYILSRTVKQILLLGDIKTVMIFIVMAMESQAKPFKSKSHNLTSTSGHLPVTQMTCKDISYENMFIPVHKICMWVSQVGPPFALVSLSRPSSMRRAKITSWFRVKNLHSSDFFLLFSLTHQFSPK